MKNCSECNVEMRKGSLFGEPFTMELDHEVDHFYVNVETGREKKTLFGTVPEVDRVPLVAAVCPKCGKVEFFIDPNKISK